MIEPAAYMFPSDLEDLEANETFASAFSVAVVRPGEITEPLYRWAEIERALAAACAEIGLPDNSHHRLLRAMQDEVET